MMIDPSLNLKNYYCHLINQSNNRKNSHKTTPQNELELFQEAKVKR